MLVRGAWRGWKTLFDSLDQYNLLSHKITIGPVVVCKSDESKIQPIISKALERFDIAFQPNMAERVKQAIEKASISEDHAVSEVVNLSEAVDLHLQIY